MVDKQLSKEKNSYFDKKVLQQSNHDIIQNLKLTAQDQVEDPFGLVQEDIKNTFEFIENNIVSTITNC